MSQLHLDRLHSRPISWSNISSWEYDKKQWARKYLDLIKDPPSREMVFGSMIGKKLETDPTFLPQIERHSKMEHEFKASISGITLIGYADTFCDVTHTKLGEFKTGKKAWDQKRVDEHRQITMYCLMNFIAMKVKPEDVEIKLWWMPTVELEDFSIAFVEPIEENIRSFTTQRTMKDILHFAAYIKKVYAEMEEYALSYQQPKEHASMVQ